MSDTSSTSQQDRSQLFTNSEPTDTLNLRLLSDDEVTDRNLPAYFTLDTPSNESSYLSNINSGDFFLQH